MHKAYPGFPLYFNYSANLGWHQFPLTTFEALADIGYKAMHVSLACLRPSLLAVWDYAADLKARGVQAEIDLEKKVLTHPLGTINDFAGFPKFKTWEATYLPAADVEKKYSIRHVPNNHKGEGMTTRREFIKDTAGALAGITLPVAVCLAHPAQAQSKPAVRRQEVVINGKRVKTIDVHSHCEFRRRWR